VAGNAPRFQIVKPCVVHYNLKVVKQGREIIVKQVEASEAWQMAPQFEYGFGDHSKLAGPAAGGVKQVAILTFGAAHDFACAGQHFQ